MAQDTFFMILTSIALVFLICDKFYGARERNGLLEKLEKRHEQFVHFVDKERFGIVPKGQYETGTTFPPVTDQAAVPENPLDAEIQKISEKETVTAEDIEKMVLHRAALARKNGGDED